MSKEKDPRLQQWEIEHWTHGVEMALTHARLGVVFPVADEAAVKASNSFRAGYAVGLQLAGQIPTTTEIPTTATGADDDDTGEVQPTGTSAGTGGMHEVSAPRLVPPDRAAPHYAGDTDDPVGG